MLVGRSGARLCQQHHFVPKLRMEKAPTLVLLGGADAHDLVLVEMLIDDYPNIIFVVLTSLNPIIPLRPKSPETVRFRDF